MNIKYEANIGESKILKTLTSTRDNIYYRTLNFKCKNIDNDQINKFTLFLNKKIEPTKIVMLSDIIILVSHNVNIVPQQHIVAHIMTLISPRMLICNDLKWGFIPNDDCNGYQFTIFIQTTH